MKTMLMPGALLVAAVLAASVLALGCSSGESNDPAPSNNTATASPAPTEAVDDTTPPPDTAPTLKAPTIDSIGKMGGALHVAWTNAETSCSAVALERKTAKVAYKVIATLPGDSDNLHDATATEATLYTYRARCKKAAAYSAYSNEMSAKPK